MKPTRSGDLRRDCSLLLLIAFGAAALSFWLNPKRVTLSWQPEGINEIELKNLPPISTEILWVDARNENAYQSGHIPGAILLNETDWNRLLPDFLQAWKPNMKIVVYCDSQECDASRGVASRLKRELNLPHVAILEGGWSAWEKSKR
jgi:3-mercaptopyruvate sulfurtransferase SseA